MVRGLRALGVLASVMLMGQSGMALAGSVEVHGSSECIDPRAAESALASVVDELRPHAEARLTVRAAVSLAGDQVHASLKLTNEVGQLLLERRYELTRADCVELTELYVLVVREFLRELPAEDWREIIAPEVEPSPPSRLGVEGALQLGAEHAPSGAVGLWGELGPGAHRFMALLWVESTTWRELGVGEYRVATSLVGAGWRYLEDSWSAEMLLMGGLARLSGRSFDENFGVWVPWVELVYSGGVSVGSVRLGGRLSVQPLTHEVAVDGESEKDAIPVVKLGMSIQVPL
jgi:hypothetical protein